MKILGVSVKKPFSMSLFCFLLLIISFLLFLWALVFSFYSNLDYVYFFFEEVYIIILVTLFGFLLLASSTFMNTASTAIYHSSQSIFDDEEKERYENLRSSIVDKMAGLCLCLFAVFLLSLSSWFSTLQAIQEEDVFRFCLFSSFCILLMIALVGITIKQMYVTANLKETSAKSHENKEGNTSVFS